MKNESSSIIYVVVFVFFKIGLVFDNIIKMFRFVLEIVKALIFIHDSNIIHLDLKPQNVMLVDPGEEFRLKLIDFGLARRLTNGYTHR